MRIRLNEIAYARSGDKGDSCNIGLAARAPEHYETLLESVTAERVKAHFSDICKGTVTRYELPNLHALNFLLSEALDGGGTRSLRMDPQGKLLCDSLMLLEIEVASAAPSEDGGNK
jgi:hypothetical protein